MKPKKDVLLKMPVKTLIVLFTVLLTACGGQQKGPAVVQVIPQPNELIPGNGWFRPAETMTLGMNETTLEPLAQRFASALAGTWNIRLSDEERTDIRLEFHSAGFPEAESYELQVTRKGVVLKAGSLHGIFNGLQSLRQMLMAAAKDPAGQKIAAVTIKDHPRFGWRGLMLDESRHFFGMERVKELLDQMALQKLNIFHWHLTDEPGWRIEINGYPLLTEVGGAGSKSDPNAPVQFYTQEEIREIIAYAADRFIEVIPEIDMPGHATAANRAYPEFSGGGSERNPEFTFDPGNEGTYAYLTAILREVAGLFPSKYIHLGGDEVHFGNQQWSSNPGIKRLMKQEGLEDMLAVESYFVKRMADSIAMLGKTVVGWDEIVDHGLSKENSVVMWWRHNLPVKLEAALQQDYPVVLCPRSPLYFDFVQHESHQVGRRWQGAYSPLNEVHAFPPDSLPEFKNRYNQVRGIQANLWTEVIKSTERLQFMTYPRMSALAEAAWTLPENKDYDQFMNRLPAMLEHLRDQGIYLFDPFNPESSPEPEL